MNTPLPMKNTLIILLFITSLLVGCDMPNKRVMTPVPSAAKQGCHLTTELYDHQKNQTTFMYECNHAIDAAGHTSYTETKPGNYFAR